MSTTKLFVELVIIGLGPAIALSLLMLAALKSDSIAIEELTFLPWMLVPALGVTYVLGIIMDRLCDMIFYQLRFRIKVISRYRSCSDQEGRAEDLGNEEPKKDQVTRTDEEAIDCFHSDRMQVLGRNQKHDDLYEYSRHRQRVCRGWAISPVMMLLGTYAFCAATYKEVSETREPART